MESPVEQSSLKQYLPGWRYRFLVTLLGVVGIAIGRYYLPVSDKVGGVAILVAGIQAVLHYFSLKAPDRKVALVQIVALASGFLYGPLFAVWTSVAGLLLGHLSWVLLSEEPRVHRIRSMERWLETGFTIGSLAIPVLVVLPAFGFPTGWPFQASGVHLWVELGFPAIVFALFHGLLWSLDILVAGKPLGEYSFQAPLLFWTVEFLPLPVILLFTEAYPAIGSKGIIALGGIVIVVAALMDRLNTIRENESRRIQELSILDRVSRTLQSTLDLEELLPVIQKQVTQIFGIDNFYVALYDAETDEIWYPLAVKYGQRQHWERRRMTDRLTDRVIREGRPIMMTPQTQAGPDPIGLPPSEDTPASWLGVPLISSEKSIGCLAVSKLTTGIEFSPHDIELLVILSGQVSVAIENALLFEQSQRRARQLETLNQLTGLITASLRPQEVLDHVCSSVALVGGSQRSAVFLLDPGADHVELAYVYGLPDDFAKHNARFSIAHSQRTRCLRSGKPFTVADIEASALSRELVRSLKAYDIHAFADFPLTTPDGQIGFLSVFYDTRHQFKQEEIDLIQTFASQAALAVANARLHAVTDAQLSRRVHQLAILEAVGRELSAATHSDELFKLILDYAFEFTNALCGAVVVMHPEKNLMELKASRGYDVEQRLLPADKGITGRAIQLKKTINIGDVSREAGFIDLRKNGATRSQLSVPIVHENRVLGVITLESSEENAFNESEQSLVMQLANQAAVALVNADLYNQTQRRLREQSILYQVSTRLVGALDPGEVVDILYRAINAVFLPNCVGFYLWEEESHQFIRWDTREEQRFPEGCFPKVLALGDVVFLKALPPGAKHLSLQGKEPGSEAFLQDPDLYQVVVCPMERGEKLLGFIVLQLERNRVFQNEELEMVEAIIAQGAIAIQNARLFADATHGRDRLSAVINSVGEGIIMVDTQGRILLLNEPIREFTGVSLAELYPLKISQLPESVLRVIGYTREELAQLQKDLGQGKIPPGKKTEYQVPGKTPILVLERETAPVFGREGAVIGWMIVLRDETEEYEIRQARKLITETLVHDLRSPMCAVTGALDVIGDSMTDEEVAPLIRQSVRVAESGARRVLGLIEALMEIARLQSGEMELAFVPVKLPQLVGELLADFILLANDYGLILRNDVPEDIPTFLADQEKLTRVLMNILDNAIKFTPEGGQIRVSAAVKDGREIVVKVEDTGPGVPEEYREKIFDRFSQIPGRKSRRRGSGLGLTFCKLAVEAHGGKIWVESPGETGSVFAFSLPLRVADDVPALS